MRKVTIKASADVALVKYWGKKDEKLRLPENGSLSMKLEGIETTTTVEFREGLAKDDVKIDGEFKNNEVRRVIKHLDRVRDLARFNLKAKVVSVNNFPKATGLSSSGSGFAALTMAASRAAGLDLDEKDLSILARLGSGSACRCVCGGFVEWLNGDSSKTSYAKTILSKKHWDIRDVVVVVESKRKSVSSTEGHNYSGTSLLYKERQKRIEKKIKKVKLAIREKEFGKLGKLVEAEALEFHSVLLTSDPPLLAWYPGTVQVMHEVLKMREEGVEAYFTISTGFNVHVLTLPIFEERVKKRIKRLALVEDVLLAKVGGKPEEIEKHLY